MEPSRRGQGGGGLPPRFPAQIRLQCGVGGFGSTKSPRRGSSGWAECASDAVHEQKAFHPARRRRWAERPPISSSQAGCLGGKRREGAEQAAAGGIPEPLKGGGGRREAEPGCMARQVGDMGATWAGILKDPGPTEDRLGGAKTGKDPREGRSGRARSKDRRKGSEGRGGRGPRRRT